MYSMLHKFVLLVAFVCLFSGSTYAQTATQPIACNVSQAVTLDEAQFNTSTWYEVARNPAPSPTINCVAVKSFLGPNNVTQVNTTYATSTTQLYKNQTITANVTLLSGTGQGFNLTYSTSTLSSSSVAKNATLKVLYIDYNKVAYVCGYTNATDNATSFGMILSVDRFPNATTLASWEKDAASKYTNFATNMANITQNKYCYTNAATAQVPTMLSALFALIYALYKYIQ